MLYLHNLISFRSLFLITRLDFVRFKMPCSYKVRLRERVSDLVTKLYALNSNMQQSILLRSAHHFARAIVYFHLKQSLFIFPNQASPIASLQLRDGFFQRVLKCYHALNLLWGRWKPRSEHKMDEGRSHGELCLVTLNLFQPIFRILDNDTSPNLLNTS